MDKRIKDLDEIKSFSRALSLESGKIIRKYFRTSIRIEEKEDHSPVTIADKLVEEKMRNMIMTEYPKHGIIGEEFGLHNQDAEYQWVIDPIDGTYSFICGTISFGTMISLLKNGKPIMGSIYQPILKEFLIGDNYSTKLNDKKVRIRECRRLQNAILVATDHINMEKYQDAIGFSRLLNLVNLYRNWGDCYGYYLLSTGYIDIMLDPIMKIWDIAPLIPIIKGAGGVITDFCGKNPMKGSSIIAASPNIHKKVLRIFNEE